MPTYKATFCTLALCAMLAAPLPARADDAAVAANQLLIAQLADGISTRIVLQKPAAYEQDALARPFVRSNEMMVVGAIATNIIARVLFRHAPTITRMLTVVEIGLATKNLMLNEKLR